MMGPSVRQIIKEEAARNGYTVEELLSTNKQPHLSAVRQYAMWRARRETGRSLGEIGLAFKRDHTTILHGCDSVEALPDEVRGVFGPRPPKKPPRKKFQPAATFYGNPCIHGHGELRYARSGKCVVCERRQDAQRYWMKKAGKLNSPGTAPTPSACPAATPAE